MAEKKPETELDTKKADAAKDEKAEKKPSKPARTVPLVAITGNVPCSLIGRDSFQEVDIVGITLPVTKHNYIVKDIT